MDGCVFLVVGGGCVFLVGDSVVYVLSVCVPFCVFSGVCVFRSVSVSHLSHHAEAEAEVDIINHHHHHLRIDLLPPPAHQKPHTLYAPRTHARAL